MSTGLLHLLCLRAAGRIPDGDLAGLRGLLAHGDHGACAARLLGAFPQSAAEIAVLTALLPPETPLLPEPAADENVDAEPTALFVPFPPADLPLYATAAPPVVDETAGGTVDDLDRALLDVLDPARTAGVWRCWRITRGRTAPSTPCGSTWSRRRRPTTNCPRSPTGGSRPSPTPGTPRRSRCTGPTCRCPRTSGRPGPGPR
ncbi:hypothetical protein ACQEUV_15470 [Micromonospora aurantiaca (nom. illeg.)]|uniref:hypothetical protein n=1 Tax=Micromonospora aurantiaca (nom. illeg.) TaxID=47850 RepID=UPI003DA520A1